MKNKISFIFLSFLLLMMISCSKEENIIYYEGGTPPVLSASSSEPLVLVIGNANSSAVRFDWTNPNYNFTTGTSSHDVSYTLQVDTAGSNFTNSRKQEVSISKDLSKTFTVKELNSLFGVSKLNLAEGMPHNVEFRLKASLAGGAAALYSNVVTLEITPYLDVAVPVPATGELWATGDAFASGWANPLADPYDVSQKFTRISNTLYELIVDMPGGGNYKILQDNGRWDTQYHMLSGGTWSGGDFEKKDADPGFPGPSVAGTYKITVDFITGKYTVVKQ
ncbi:MAG TPA: SusE domain-containing protein [Flavisolibacter sp.]|nr:SusE domain-containing protein [Flavisolibacter sp.]